MIKKLLLTIVVAVACISMAKGQALVPDNGFLQRNALAPLTYMPKVPKAPMKALGQNEMYMGPYVSDALGEYGLGLTSLPGTYKICSFLPVDLVKNFEGGTVTRIRFGLMAAVTEAAVYMIPVTKTSPFTVGDPVIQQVLKSTSAGWNEITITNPYVIDTEGVVGFLLGYKYKQLSGSTDACYPISAVMEGTIYPTYMDGVQGQSWQDIGLSSYGNLSVQAVVQSDNFQDYNLQLNSLDCEEFGSIEKGLSYVLTMSNVGVATLNDYKLDLLVDGNVIQTLNSPVALTQAATQYSGVLPLEGIEPGQHTFTIRAVEAAGEEVSDQEVSSNFVVYSFAYPRQKQLVEHFTSQGCTYCYLGDAVLRALDNLRGDLAWVSIHGNLGVTDIFNTTKCEQIMSYLECTGFPSASFNRHPYDGELSPGLGYNISYAQQVAQMLSDEAIDANPTPALANIDLSATFDPETRKLDVTVAGEATSDFSTIFGSNVAITVYLTEDSLVARQYSNGSWNQNFVHDHVMRDVLSKTVYGDAINWTSETTYSNTFSTTLNSAWRSEKMHIVAFINRTGSGKKDVINAEIIDIPEPVEPALYLLGSFNEWSEETMEPLTLGEDGKWTITKEMEADAEFKLMDEAGNWLGGITDGDNFIVTQEQVSDSTELSLSTPGMNFQIPVAGTWTLTVDKENMNLVITGEWVEPQPEPEEVYILGEVGENNWAPNVGVKMENEEDSKVFTAEVTFDGRNDGFNYFSFTTKLAENADDWDGIAPYRFTAVSEGNFEVTEELLGQSISLDEDGANYNNAIKIPAGDYTLTVDRENKTLVIEKKAAPGILGDIDGSGIVDVEDVNAAINIILKLNTISDYPGNGDMDGNGMIDVEDVNAIINIILKLPTGNDTTPEVNPANVFTNGLPKSLNDMTVSTNSEGQVTSISNGETIVTFEYVNHSAKSDPTADADVIMRIEDEGDYLMYLITLGDNGFATHAVEYNSDNGQDYVQGDILDFTYDNDGHLIKMVQNYDCDDVTNIEWNNGDITKVNFVDGESDTENWDNVVSYTNDNHETAIENKGCVMLYDEIFGVDVDAMAFAYYAGMLGKATNHLPLGVTFTGGYGTTVAFTYDWVLNNDGFPVSIDIDSFGTLTFSW